MQATCPKCPVCHEAVVPGQSFYTKEEGQIHADGCFDQCAPRTHPVDG